MPKTPTSRTAEEDAVEETAAPVDPAELVTDPGTTLGTHVKDESVTDQGTTLDT